ncbi:MAG: hypothetical protein WA718_06340 [Terriglobales bacterium]
MSRIYRQCSDSLISDHLATTELFARVRQEPDRDEEEDEEDEDDGKEEEKDDEDEDTTDAGYSE